MVREIQRAQIVELKAALVRALALARSALVAEKKNNAAFDELTALEKKL